MLNLFLTAGVRTYKRTDEAQKAAVSAILNEEPETEAGPDPGAFDPVTTGKPAADAAQDQVKDQPAVMPATASTSSATMLFQNCQVYLR